MAENEIILMADEMEALTDKQRAFVLFYLAGDSTMLNASGSARAAGYNWPHQQAFEILRSEKVQAIVKRFFDELSMPTEEIIYRLSQMAQASISWFLRKNERGDLELDPDALLALGFLVKGVTWDKDGRILFQLHDSMKAMELIGRYRGAFTSDVNVNVMDTRDQRDSKYAEALMKVYGNYKERYDRIETDNGIELVEKESLTDEDRARLDSELEQAQADIASETERLLGTDGKAAIEAAKTASENYYVRGRRK